MKSWVIGLAIAMAMIGCATLDSVQPGAGGSTFEVRGRSYDAIWKAAVRVAGQSLTIVESDKAAGTLRAEKGVGLTTWRVRGDLHPTAA